MPVLHYNHIDYAYRQYGDQDAPAIVLVMGLGMSGALWPESWIREFLAQGFQVICPDNRDSGQSTRFEAVRPKEKDLARAVLASILHRPVMSQYALEDMAFDIERLLDSLNIRRAHVLGISMGGMIAQALALQCPNRVASLTSMSSASGNIVTGFGNPMVISGLLFTRSDEGTLEEKRTRVKRYFTRLAGRAYEPNDKELDRVADIVLSEGLDQNAQRRQLLAIFASGDRRAQLRQIRVPTLVIHGDKDPLLPVRAGRECNALIKDSVYHEIKGMGHVMTHALIPTLAKLVTEHCRRHPA